MDRHLSVPGPGSSAQTRQYRCGERDRRRGIAFLSGGRAARGRNMLRCTPHPIHPWRLHRDSRHPAPCRGCDTRRCRLAVAPIRTRCSEVARSNPVFTLFPHWPKARAREAALAREAASPGKSSSQRLTRHAIERANLPHRLWLPRLVRAAIISLHREASRAAKRFERCARGC